MLEVSLKKKRKKILVRNASNNAARKTAIFKETDTRTVSKTSGISESTATRKVLGKTKVFQKTANSTGSIKIVFLRRLPPELPQN